MKAKRKNNRSFWVAFGVIALSLGAIFFQAMRNGSTVVFFTPAEVYAQPEHFQDKVFRVSGLVKTHSKQWDPTKPLLKFEITDLKGHEFSVIYHGIPPDLFRERQGVIIEGRLQNSPLHSRNPYLLHANLLLVKHSEVYDSHKDHSQTKSMKLLDSMENPQQRAASL